jgi:hypothetical protein
MDKVEIEKLEKRYFDEICFLIDNNIDWIIKRLDSKNSIKKDWIDFFKTTGRKNYNNSSEIDTGAERVLHNLFGTYRAFAVQSTPVGSDLMFESPDAIIHIEVKTATDTNNADFNGKIQISQNQTTYAVSKNYKGNDYPFSPSLPKVYSNGKICLTYVIQIIHNNEESLPKLITIFSIPNGLLKETYGNCVNAGKGQKQLNKLESKKDIRFLYKEANNFRNLNQTPSRIKVAYPTNPQKELLKKYLGLKNL